MDFVAIDFETANSLRSSACSLGIVIVENGKITDTKEWLVRPKENYFDPYNTYIHGITEEDVKNEPEFNELWPEIKNYLENNLVIAHNASFDLSVLRYVLDEYKLPYPELDYSCTRVVSKKTWGKLINYRLETVAELLEIKFQHHNALEDALASAKVLLKCFEHHQSDHIDDLCEKLEIVKGKLFEGGYTPAGQKSSSFKISDIKPTTDDFDLNHPFHSSNIVFTGTLQSMVRKDAMQKVVNVGGNCSNSINKKTNFLVMGDQDYRKFTDGTKSSKFKKAEEMITNGYDIEIISEHEFITLL